MNINVNQKVEVDNRIPLWFYYRIAENLLRQAVIHREEKNIVDLYIILIRFSSLVSETIPFHKDYQVLLPKERVSYRKRLLGVLDELESLKPEYLRCVDKLNKGYANKQIRELNGSERNSSGFEPSTSENFPVNRVSYSSVNVKQPYGVALQSSSKYNYNHTQDSQLNTLPVDKQFNKLSISLPLPKQETLSRHSFLGPNGLRGQWRGPTAEIKVQYPNYADVSSAENSSLDQSGLYDIAVTDSKSGVIESTMESLLSLNDGRWHPAKESIPALIHEVREDPFQFVGTRQPSPPPVLAQLQQGFSPIPPSRVADPRPGPAKSCQDGIESAYSYKHLHVPVKLMENFLRLAHANTQKNLETCGILAGSLKNRVFEITALIIPKQESTSDSCQTSHEEEIFEVQDKKNLFPLGWIHTHPSQTCFMSSVDLHTHYSYQIMIAESIAIVMAPTDTSSPHGIFHLSDPGGVKVIRNCQERGFHPHEEPLDGTPIYEHCSHVYMNSKVDFEVIDLR
ncbi:AMSH-like ubiquitin thioesterase 3 [Mercurialis annua]|uniref:AMSH-like ubiquitin thioesterase 3 n=1 Tax=Mercurialis annua TaxID=3986 RepID=UPI00215E35AD|nr:AMSH-like ubiquitin thioesterase 3 [Mercurialis annua]